MKNRELIQQLQRYPEDAEALIQTGNPETPDQTWTIRSVQMHQGGSESGRKGGEVYLNAEESKRAQDASSSTQQSPSSTSRST